MATLISWLILAAAASNACASELPEPICATDFAYGARGQIEPTVVTSLTVVKGTLLRLPHGPRVAIRAMEELEEPEDRPGFPPVATI